MKKEILPIPFSLQNLAEQSSEHVISMYFHPHSTHSAPPLDTPGALQYHPGDHPQFTSLCHLPDILVSNPRLNSSDLRVSESHWHFQTFTLAVLPPLFNPI